MNILSFLCSSRQILPIPVEKIFTPGDDFEQVVPIPSQIKCL